jgi:hypothetical protein
MIFETIEKCPSFQEYVSRNQQRPAMQSANQLNEEKLANS